MRELGLRRLIQGENTSWTLPHETIGPGAQLQSESHSLRATIEGQQRKLAGLPDPDMLDYYYQSTHHQSHNKLEWMIRILLETVRHITALL